MEEEILKFFESNNMVYLNKIPNLTKEQINFIFDSNLLLRQDSSRIRMFFFRTSSETKIKMIEDDKMFSIIADFIKKNDFKNFDIDVNRAFLKRKKSLSPELHKSLLLEISKQDVVSNEVNIFLKKITSDVELIRKIEHKINKDSNFAANILKVKNELELILLEKFGILLRAKLVDEMVYLGNSNDIVISKNLILNIKSKYILKLMKLVSFQQVYEQNITSEQLVYLLIKLYQVFGYDNSVKILSNKFSNLTKASISRVAEFKFDQMRKSYRIANQNLFYSNELLKKAYNALKKENSTFFNCLSDNIELNQQFYQILKIQIATIEDSQDQKNLLEYLLKNFIETREMLCRSVYVNKYKNSKEIYLKEKRVIDYSFLYSQLSLIKDNINVDGNGNVIENREMNEFLLGNSKFDNDCIFRIILTKEISELENIFPIIVNNFSKIVKIVQDSKNSKEPLSMNSLSDLIGLSKTFVLSSKPNEQDLSLSIITKLIRSVKFCSLTQPEILKRARNLHQASRRKISSSIPFVHGKAGNIEYGVKKFQDPELLVIGIDAGNCLKIGAQGEELLKYAMLGKDCVILEFVSNNDNAKYFSVVLRNGNGIFLNGIDPEPESDERKIELLNAMKVCCEDIISKSYNDEKIEFAFVSDLHQKEFMKSTSLNKKDIDFYVPLEQGIYLDIGKEDIDMYELCSKKGKKLRQYQPQMEYLQERPPVYFYDVEKEGISQVVELLVNDIAFTSLENMKSNKNSIKYSSIQLADCKYIAGNKDWFVLVDINNNVKCCILDYDKRAIKEYGDMMKKLPMLVKNYTIRHNDKKLQKKM